MKRIFCIVCLVCFFCLTIAAEEPVQPAKTPELTELEQLALSNLLKDFTIAQLQRQAAQRNEDVARGAFWAAVNRLRAEKDAPEAEFTFNPQTMSFTAKPPAPAAQPETGPPGADKPQSPPAGKNGAGKDTEKE